MSEDIKKINIEELEAVAGGNDGITPSDQIHNLAYFVEHKVDNTEDYTKIGVQNPFKKEKTPKKDGKGNPYVDVINRHMPIIDAMQTASRRAFKRAFG